MKEELPSKLYIEEMTAMMLNDIKIRTCTKYVSPNMVIRLTRRTKGSKRNTRNEWVLTVGEPNYLGKLVVKSLKKAKEPFPVKKILVGFYPKKRKPK